MALVYRDGQVYRYRSIRVGGKVTSRYLGSGLLAGIEEQRGRIRRAVDQHARRATVRARDAPDELERDLEAATRSALTLAHQALEQAGYHQPKRGPWRKKRHVTPKTD
jgi:hypothetical protein